MTGHIQLNADGTCSISISLRITEGSAVTTETETDTCTWTQNNTAISLTYSAGDTESGSLIDDRISITSDGVVFLFEK